MQIFHRCNLVQFSAIYLGRLEASLVSFTRNFGGHGVLAWAGVLMMQALLRRAVWPQEQTLRHENPGKWSLNYPELSWKSTTYISIRLAAKRRKSQKTDLWQGRDSQSNPPLCLLDLNSQKPYFKEQGA
jgi:hypothetical protein